MNRVCSNLLRAFIKHSVETISRTHGNLTVAWSKGGGTGVGCDECTNGKENLMIP